MINTREIAAEYRLERWAGIVRERAESGLTIKAFCESAGLHQNTYFYWQRSASPLSSARFALFAVLFCTAAEAAQNRQRKLRESACEDMVPGALRVPGGWTAAVPAKPRTLDVSGTLPIEIGKCRVIADRDTDERLLAKVCRVLASL